SVVREFGFLCVCLFMCERERERESEFERVCVRERNSACVYVCVCVQVCVRVCETLRSLSPLSAVLKCIPPDLGGCCWRPAPSPCPGLSSPLPLAASRLFSTPR